MRRGIQRTQVQQEEQIPHLQGRKLKSRNFYLTKVLEKTGQREEDWSNFIQALPNKDPRMCVFDLEHLPIFIYAEEQQEPGDSH